MYITILVVFLLISITLIFMVILQQGKGIDMGSSFSNSASTSLFGSSGSGHFMTKMISIFAIIFFVISLILGNLTSNKSITRSKWENIDGPVKFSKSGDAPIAPVPPSNNDIPHE